jgi:hypothetical protein
MGNLPMRYLWFVARSRLAQSPHLRSLETPGQALNTVSDPEDRAGAIPSHVS